MIKGFNLYKATFITLISLILIGLGFLLLLSRYSVFSANDSSNLENVELVEFNKIADRYKFIDSLIDGAKESQKKYGIKPSIIIAQGILESSWGTSDLSKEYNNLFGIKGVEENSVTLETEEFVNGKSVTVNENFQKFDSLGDSIIRHAELLKNGTDEDSNKYKKVIDSKDYKDAAIQLQLAGYATDPNYANKLIAIIDQYDLQQYD